MGKSPDVSDVCAVTGVVAAVGIAGAEAEQQKRGTAEIPVLALFYCTMK